MFHWLEAQSWIPASLHLWIELGIVIVGVVVAVGVGCMLFGFGVSVIAGSFRLGKNFWRWCFLAPVAVAKSWWPILDDKWEAWLLRRSGKQAERAELMKYRKEERGQGREVFAFSIDAYTKSCWEQLYLLQRRRGENFRGWFAGKMDSLAMTSVLTAEQAFSSSPEEEKLT